MIYNQFVTIRTLLNKVCYGFQHIFSNIVHTLELSFINKCVPKYVTISLTLFGLQYEISDL
mgnify:CR=1 FL=1